MPVIENQIEHILEHFDFERVQKVMRALNWVWARNNDIPTIADLKETARNLLEIVEQQQFQNFVQGSGNDQPINRNFAETGGFRAQAIELPHGRRFLELQFIVEQWDTYHGE